MFNYKQSMRSFVQASMLMILILILSACNTLFSVGASAPSATGATENQPDPQDSPGLPTQKPEIVTPTPLADQRTYTNERYGFEFAYPDAWTLEEEGQAIVLRQDLFHLRIHCGWASEDIGPGMFGRTGVSAGDFIYAGKVNFLGQVIPADALVFEGKTKGIFYNQTRLIEVDDLVFMIELSQTGEDYSSIDIPETKQIEASFIIQTFKRTDPAAQCLRQGGRWEILGFSGPGCNLPTTDGGIPCSDIRECEGLCMADSDEIMMDNGQGILVPDSGRIAEINAKGDELQGVCSNWQSNFGCHVVVEDGKYVEICVD